MFVRNKNNNDMNHSTLEIGTSYNRIGDQHATYKCISVSSKVINRGFNSYAKAATFLRIDSAEWCEDKKQTFFFDELESDVFTSVMFK